MTKPEDVAYLLKAEGSLQENEIKSRLKCEFYAIAFCQNFSTIEVLIS